MKLVIEIDDNEYIGIKEYPNNITSYPVTIHLYDAVRNGTPFPRCKDCKWWKDSDGAFRRGIGAESRCPINREEVYEGNGYCFLFEPQERSDKE